MTATEELRRTTSPSGRLSRLEPGSRYDVVVVGAGLTGLAAAFWLGRLAPDASIAVLEASDRPGGRAWSREVDGFVIDTGPGSLMANDPRVAPLIAALGIEELVLPPNTDATRRHIVKAGELVELPRKPPDILLSPMLSLRGKLRALLEPAVPRHAGDETVAGFLERRFGREAANLLGQAVVSGMVAGDPAELSVEALLPGLKRLEDAHGSLLRGLIASRGAGGRRSLAVLRGGMITLASTLAAQVAGALHLGVSVERVEASTDAFEVTLGGGRRIRAEQVVVALPGPSAARLLASVAPGASGPLAGVRYASVGVVALGFEASALPPLEGFGFVAPRGQGVRSLGILYSSSMWRGAAPPGYVSVRAIAGGELDPAFVGLTEEAKVAAVLDDIRTAMGVRPDPVMTYVENWPAGIPQYPLGHRTVVTQVQRALAGMPGLHLATDALGGPGLADRLGQGRAVAESAASRWEADRVVG